MCLVGAIAFACVRQPAWGRVGLRGAPMGALALSLLALFACASSQCLGAGETSAFTLSATRFMGTVQSVTYVTPERLVLQTDDPDRSIYFSLDGGLTWFEVCWHRRVSTGALR